MLGSELYAGLLDRLLGDIRGGGPGRRVLEPFADWPGERAYVLRVMGAVHRLVLTGEAPELAPEFAPGGSPERGWPAFIGLLEERGEEIRSLALANPVQTNEVGRCAALGPALLWLSGGRPLRLLELGASAGLNLRWDAYRYEDRWGDPASPVRLVDRYPAEPPPFEPDTVEVAERRGCDRHPVEEPLTLLSFVWPDQAERIELLRGALAVAERVPAVVDQTAAGDWVERALAEEASAGMATVVFHSIFWQYLDDAERGQIGSALARAGAHASAHSPLAWLRMEADGADTRVEATTWPGGETRLLARAGYHGRPVRWLAAP
jgi:hypothetical protein